MSPFVLPVCPPARFVHARPSAAADGSPGVGHPVSPAGKGSVETAGSPTFLGNPDFALALLSDPGRTNASGHNDASARPPLCPRRRLPHSYFRGSITRLRHWLSTLRRPGRPDTTQDSLPVAGQALPDGLAYPQGSIERFHDISYFLLSILLSQVQRSARTFYFFSCWRREGPIESVHGENGKGISGRCLLPCAQSRQWSCRGVSQEGRLRRLSGFDGAGARATADAVVGLVPDTEPFSSGSLAARSRRLEPMDATAPDFAREELPSALSWERARLARAFQSLSHRRRRAFADSVALCRAKRAACQLGEVCAGLAVVFGGGAEWWEACRDVGPGAAATR